MWPESLRITSSAFGRVLARVRVWSTGMILSPSQWMISVGCRILGKSARRSASLFKRRKAIAASGAARSMIWRPQRLMWAWHAQIDKTIQGGRVGVLQAFQERVSRRIQPAKHRAIHDHQAADALGLLQRRAQGRQSARGFRREHAALNAVRVQHGKHVIDQVRQRDRFHRSDAGPGAPLVVPYQLNRLVQPKTARGPKAATAGLVRHASSNAQHGRAAGHARWPPRQCACPRPAARNGSRQSARNGCQMRKRWRSA